MTKACLIIPYYGKWPPYLNIFLKGCENNKWLDVIFFTDIKDTPLHPNNVYFVDYSLKQLENKVSQILNIQNFVLPNAYKLCDLRPLYGQIFKEEIKGYQYWAFGDCDVLYGNLLKFIKDDFDKNVDLISFNEARISGALTFLKNQDTTNYLYANFPNYIDLIKQPDFKGMDEVCHQWNTTDKLKLPKNCLTYWIAIETEKGAISSSFKNRIIEELKSNDLIKYGNANVSYNRKEIAFFHYVCNKDKPIFSFPNWRDIPGTFYINETGFYKNKASAYFLRLFKKHPILFLYYLRKLPKWIYKKLSRG